MFFVFLCYWLLLIKGTNDVLWRLGFSNDDVETRKLEPRMNISLSLFCFFFCFFCLFFFGHSLSKKKDESYLLLRTTVVYFTIMWLRMYEVINSFCISFSRPFLWSITETTPCTCYAPVLWHLTTINLLLYCSCHQFPEHCANSSFSSFWCWFGWRNQWRETSWVLTLQLLGLKKISRTQII